MTLAIFVTPPVCTEGLMCGSVQPPSNQMITTEPAVPRLCKELIGRSLAHLRSCSETEETLADRLMSDLNLVYTAVQTISDLYESLDDDSQDSGEQQLIFQSFMQYYESPLFNC